MIRSAALAVLVLVALACLSACGEQPSEGEPVFAEQPLTIVSSDAGKLSLAIWTSPDQPPSRGTLALRLLVRDTETDQPVDGLVFDVVPEMPSMGHGTPTIPKTAASGDGVYIASDVNLFMAGRWELRFTISGSRSDVAIVTLDVR